VYASLRKGVDDVFTVALPRALELLAGKPACDAEKLARDAEKLARVAERPTRDAEKAAKDDARLIKELGMYLGQPMRVLMGRAGPFLKFGWGKTAKLPIAMRKAPMEITLEMAKKVVEEVLALRVEWTAGKRPESSSASPGKKTVAGKRAAAGDDVAVHNVVAVNNETVNNVAVNNVAVNNVAVNNAAAVNSAAAVNETAVGYKKAPESSKSTSANMGVNKTVAMKKPAAKTGLIGERQKILEEVLAKAVRAVRRIQGGSGECEEDPVIFLERWADNVVGK